MKNIKKLILAGNGPYTNRGCEAITRGTVECFKRVFGDIDVIALTAYKYSEQYEQQKLSEYDNSISHKKMISASKRFQFVWWITSALKVIAPKFTKYLTYKNILCDIPSSHAVLSIGGDNYSLDYADNVKTYTDLDDLVINNKKPLIIWGASVGPFSRIPEYEKYMSKHLKDIHIFARETMTVKYLKSIGVHKNVYLMADPAFLMKPIKPNIEIDIPENSIGLNFSPLMAKFVTDGDMKKWIDMTVQSVMELHKALNCDIFLIPHVTGVIGNDDYVLLNEVFKTVSSPKVHLLPGNLNSTEVKWVISKMKVFAGARTHSTIAGFSSKVPTVSFAYSMKAQGLNNDIYGNLDYCILPENLSVNTIVDTVIKAYENQDELKSILNTIVPELENKVLNAGEKVKEIIEQQ